MFICHTVMMENRRAIFLHKLSQKQAKTEMVADIYRSLGTKVGSFIYELPVEFITIQQYGSNTQRVQNTDIPFCVWWL